MVSIMNTKTQASDILAYNHPAVPLREFLEILLGKHEEINNASFAAMDARIIASDKVLEARLDFLNHVRVQRDEDRSQFVKIDTYTAQHQSLENRLEVAARETAARVDTETKSLAARVDTETKSLAARVDDVADDVKSLQLAKAVLDGKASQSSVNIALVISILGLLVASVAAILEVINLLRR